MEPNESGNNRGRLARILLAVALATVAISSFRKGKRVRGLLAVVGAGALGYTVTAGSKSPAEEIDIDVPGVGDSEDTTSGSESAERSSGAEKLRCAACGEPIRPGQSRGPNADDEIVHESCMQAAE